MPHPAHFARCHSLLYLSEHYFKKHESEADLEEFYRDWTLACPIRPLTWNGTEAPDKVIDDLMEDDNANELSSVQPVKSVKSRNRVEAEEIEVISKIEEEPKRVMTND